MWDNWIDHEHSYNHLPCLRSPRQSSDPNGQLPILLQVFGMRRHAETSARRLLCSLLVCGRSVSIEASRESSLTNDFAMLRCVSVGLSFGDFELRPPGLRRRLNELKVAAKLASVFLLLWLFVSPAMACLLPKVMLTPDEMACCRHMGGMCDEMGKSTTHSCCVKVKTNSPSYVVSRAKSFSAQPLQVDLSTVLTAQNTSLSVITAETVSANEESPPGDSPPELYTLHSCLLI